MNRFAKTGEIAEPCGVPRSRVCRVPSAVCNGATSHRLTYNSTHRVAVSSLSFLAKHLVGVSCVAVLGVPGREVYYLYMASIVGKRQGNATYYYLVESARVDGKPRIVSQQYLG